MKTNQHYVPQCYLRLWRAPNGKLHYLDKSNGNHTFIRGNLPSKRGPISGATSPKELCSKLMMYESPNLRENEVENRLSVIESEIFPRYMSAIKNIESCSAEDRMVISFFISVMHLRSPRTLGLAEEVRKDHVKNSHIKLAEILEESKLDHQLKLQVQSDINVQNYIKSGLEKQSALEIWWNLFPESVPKFAEMFFRYKWLIMEDKENRIPTFDIPAVLMGTSPKRSSAIFFPLSPRYALYAEENNNSEISLSFTKDRKGVQDYIDYILQSYSGDLVIANHQIYIPPSKEK